MLVTGRCNFIMPLFSSKFLKHCILGPLTDIYEVTKHAAVLDPLSRAEEGEPVLLSSVSPSLFVVLGAVSASVILLTVVMAALYVRYVVELQTKVCEDFTIMEKTPIRAFSWLKVPTSTSAFTFKTLLRHGVGYNERFLKPPVPYDNCVGGPTSCLLTRFRRPFSIVS